MKRGKLYKVDAPSWLCECDAPLKKFISYVPVDSVIIYLEQSLFAPYTHKVIFSDQMGYILAYSFSEIQHAESQTET